MKKILSFAALLLAFVSLSWGHDFSAVAPSGQTLYYYINNESTVSVACPGAVYSWNGFTEPSGSLVIPSTVTYNSHTYSVTSIDRRAFAACSGITSVTIPNSVTTIGDHAFDGCIGLTSVTIPNSVTSIGNCAFKACRGLTSVTIGNSVTSIGHEAFHDCSGITSVTIPNSVTSIDYGAFYLVRNIVYNGTATGSSWGALCVNGYIEGDLVYTDSTKTHLAGCVTTATSVAIPNSVTTIGDHAFDGCIGLTSVTIPNSVTSIGDGAFYDCNSLASVIISNSVTSIGKYAFSNCSGLTNVTIPNSVTSIGNNAFEFVRNIVYHGTATGSPWGALCVNGYIDGDLIYTDSSKTHLVGCVTTATSVTIPNSVTSIGNYAFSGCSSLTNITFNAINCTNIGYDVFSDCTNFTSLTIGDSVQTIPNRAFAYCSSLTSLTIGNSVTAIGNSAFAYCSGLTRLSIPNSVTAIGNSAFRGCNGLTSLTIPNSVTTINWFAFSGCSGLNSLTIGNSVTSIGDWAFDGCNGLNSLTIGNSVTSIGKYAFYGCSGLTDITSLASEAPQLDYDAFRNVPSTTPVYIPCGSSTSYDSRWSYFSNFVESAEILLHATAADSTQGIVRVQTEPTCDNPTAVIFAAANTGYRFDHWSDGNTDNPRYLVLTGDTTIFAYFLSDQEFTITVESNDPTMGTVFGGGEFADGTTTSISATPYDGYRFVQWQDGNTDNPRTITVTADATYTAYFESTQGIENTTDMTDIVIRTIGSSIVIEGIANETVRLFDCMGRCLQTVRATKDCTLQAPTAGVYMLQVANNPAQRIVVLR